MLPGMLRRASSGASCFLRATASPSSSSSSSSPSSSSFSTAISSSSGLGGIALSPPAAVLQEELPLPLPCPSAASAAASLSSSLSWKPRGRRSYSGGPDSTTDGRSSLFPALLGGGRGGGTAEGSERRLTVAVGLSGGVDSAVTAMLLKGAGHDVVGVYMRNWDAREEAGGAPGTCPAEEDLADARRVCETIGIPLHEIDFVAEYWTRVFEGFVEQHRRGLTPNPDLDCNRHIKFQALLEHVIGMGADAMATGHYARLRQAPGPEGPEVQLLRGADRAKDQTYFLASVQQEALQKAIFPLGGMTKESVRRMAEASGIHVAHKKGSRGICFIGKRPFGDFISQYVEPRRGRFVSVEDGQDLGEVLTMASVTHGQGARLPGRAEPWFVAGKDVVDGVVHCAPGSEHPALLNSSAALRPPFWVSGRPPEPLLREEGGRRMDVLCKARYGQTPVDGRISWAAWEDEEGAAHAGGGGAFVPSRFCRLQEEDSAAGAEGLRVDFRDPVRAVTPQQACVFYDGEVCLGGALIAVPGLSVYEQQQHEQQQLE